MSDETPLYRHDCDRCRFLGRHRYSDDDADGGETHDTDLYWCDRSHGQPIVLARFGEGPDSWWSTPDVIRALEDGEPSGRIATSVSAAIKAAMAKGLPLR
jgi:hypothetical protein